MAIPILSAEQLALIQNAADYLITGSDKTCRIVYPGKRVQCPSCNGGLSNPYHNRTKCAVCQGEGFKEEVTTEDVTLKLTWFNINEQIQIAKRLGSDSIPNTVIHIPYGILRTRGFQSILPKILQAEKLIVSTPTEHLIRQTFVRITEPIDNMGITQNRYFECYWSRTADNG